MSRRSGYEVVDLSVWRGVAGTGEMKYNSAGGWIGRREYGKVKSRYLLLR